jgi:myo-inositol-1(or 4)-monophosphatase
MRAFPEHSILSEERAPKLGTAPYKWIIDPLDGTTNFTHAFPFFCVSIGLEAAGQMLLGAVYDPMRDEMFFAERGKGAYLNGRKISVSNKAKLADGFLATGFSYGMKRKDLNIRHFVKLLMRSLAIRRAGSAALDLCYVACGRFDGFWEMDLHPWDSAAGTVIVNEAGGRVTRFDNTPYTPYEKDILATNGRIHGGISRILTGMQ